MIHGVLDAGGNVDIHNISGHPDDKQIPQPLVKQQFGADARVGTTQDRGKRVLGDASTSYSRIRYHPHTIARIRSHVPDVKIIYMVRHPLERIESAYIERLASVDARRGYPDINHAVRAEPMMIDSSRYWEVFDRYRRHFDEGRIKIVWFEAGTGTSLFVFLSRRR